MKLLKVIIVNCFFVLLSAPATAAPEINFIYFGAADCSYCRAWESIELPKLQAAPEWQRVKFTKIVKSIPAPMPGAFWWPADIRHLQAAVKEKFNERRIRGGTPMYALVVDGEVVYFGRGVSRIAAERLLPLISAALAAKEAQ